MSFGPTVDDDMESPLDVLSRAATLIHDQLHKSAAAAAAAIKQQGKNVVRPGAEKVAPFCCIVCALTARNKMSGMSMLLG